jgi:hypothetical protein
MSIGIVFYGAKIRIISQMTILSHLFVVPLPKIYLYESTAK